MGAIFFSLAFHPVDEVIQIIHDAGGVAIIAGGYLRNPDILIADVERMVACGADGVEGFSPNYSADVAATLRETAKEHQLLLTGGGDGRENWGTRGKYGIGKVDIDDKQLNLGAIRIYGAST